MILLTNTDIKNAIPVAEEIRKIIEDKPFFIGNETTIHVTISCGVTQYIKQEKLDDCFNRLDRALYQAKNNGRNQIVVM